MANIALGAQSVVATTVLAGSVGNTFNIILRVRIKAPLKTYTGGTVVQPYVRSGAVTPAVDNVETVKLTISNPAATYYLNNGTSGSPEGCVFLDYRLAVTVVGNATLTLTVDSIDSSCPAELVVGEDSVEDPENDVLDNFQGVFAQIDHSDEYIDQTVSEQTGGGVRGFKFGGYSEDVLNNGAEQ